MLERFEDPAAREVATLMKATLEGRPPWGLLSLTGLGVLVKLLGMFAIIETCGKQYKVSEGDVIRTDLLEFEVGSDVTFDHVILADRATTSKSARDGRRRLGHRDGSAPGQGQEIPRLPL